MTDNTDKTRGGVMKTRRDYMDGKVTHQDYYVEIAKEARITAPEQLLERAAKSTDKYYNDVPLKLWDMAGIAINSRRLSDVMKARGDYVTQAGLVCVLKAIVRDTLTQGQTNKEATDGK